MKVAIFDLDGTLVRKWTSDPIPNVLRRLRELERRGIRFVVATNQAGVAWRAQTGQEKFPSASEVARRLLKVAEVLPPLGNALWLVSIHDDRVPLSPQRYRGLAAAVTRSARPLHVRTSGLPDWRKPNPGMLYYACRAMGVLVSEAVFIGDRPEDEEAAGRAGIRFVPIDEFLSLDKV